MPVFIIYKIQIHDCIYIGSTKDLKQRKTTHKQSCTNENNKHHHLMVYQIIRENGGWNNSYMAPIEEFECDTPLQSKIREQYWINQYNANLNVNRAYVSEEEKREEKQEENAIRNPINNARNNATKLTCACGGLYYRTGKNMHDSTKSHKAFIALHTPEPVTANFP